MVKLTKHYRSLNITVFNDVPVMGLLHKDTPLCRGDWKLMFTEQIDHHKNRPICQVPPETIKEGDFYLIFWMFRYLVDQGAVIKLTPAQYHVIPYKTFLPVGMAEKLFGKWFIRYWQTDYYEFVVPVRFVARFMRYRLQTKPFIVEKREHTSWTRQIDITRYFSPVIELFEFVPVQLRSMFWTSVTMNDYEGVRQVVEDILSLWEKEVGK